jgi:lantibiotic modifying enzyme
LNIELKLTKIYLKIEKEISKLKISDIYEIKDSAIRRDSDTTFSYLEKLKGQTNYSVVYTNLDITNVMDVTSEIIPDLI